MDLSAQPQKETESPELDDEAADYTARELEARMIAGKIREMTDKNGGSRSGIRSLALTVGRSTGIL